MDLQAKSRVQWNKDITTRLDRNFLQLHRVKYRLILFPWPRITKSYHYKAGDKVTAE
jgi:hypothetical protein